MLKKALKLLAGLAVGAAVVVGIYYLGVAIGVTLAALATIGYVVGVPVSVARVATGKEKAKSPLNAVFAHMVGICIIAVFLPAVYAYFAFGFILLAIIDLIVSALFYDYSSSDTTTGDNVEETDTTSDASMDVDTGEVTTKDNTDDHSVDELVNKTKYSSDSGTTI